MKHDIISTMLRTLAFGLIAVASQRTTAQVILIGDAGAVETCSGAFYDSGGPSSNYANSEDLTTTICPAGGEGAGPLTSVRFVVWNVAPGTGDQLFIHDGSSTSDPLIVTGNGVNSLAGQTFTATNPGGCLTFQWVSDASSTAPGWEAVVITGPDAGEDNAITICTDEPVFNMRLRLNGTPQSLGEWTGIDGLPRTRFFDATIDPPGVYTYTVSEPVPCPAAVATLTITLVDAPDAGEDALLSLCSNADPVDLITVLGGLPQPGGSWTGPGAAPHSGTFLPGVDAPGVYTYTVPANEPPCTDVSATVTISVTTAPDAGQSATAEVCSLDSPFALFGVLGGTPHGGGAWTGPLGTPVPPTFDPSSSLPGDYTYTVAGDAPCNNAQAVVTVNVTAAPDPGISRSINVCSNDIPFLLVSRLNGTPQPGGTWTAPGNVPFGDTFDPAVDAEGVYTYTVPGSGPCADRSATLTITVRTAPNAGSSSDLLLCSSDGSVALLGELGGSPDANGTWTGPDALPFGGTFLPGTSQPGIYTYTVTGLAPCVPATATVEVSVTIAPVAGGNGTVALCSDDAPYALTQSLSGIPDAGGSWTGPDATPHSGTFVPGTDAPGPYTYVVAGQDPCPDASAVVTVSVSIAPDAGTDGEITVCYTDAVFSLFDQLGGTPSLSGSWTNPDGLPCDGDLDPALALPGVYTYTVTGVAPCADAIAQVTVNVNIAPEAGTNGSITVCSDGPEVDLFSLLGGAPDAGGTWAAPGGGSHSGTYLPGNEAGGIYTYTVLGVAPCANATASVQVVRNIKPRAGTNGTITVCSTGGQFNLLSVLGGSPMGTGVWTSPNDQPVPGGLFNPGSSMPGIYRYVVAGTAPCVNDTAFAQVNVNVAPVAGNNNSALLCSTDDPVALVSLLAGTPNAGGTWTAPGDVPHTAQFIPGSDQPGNYTYRVTGQAPCLDATATVSVEVEQQPNAGSNASITVCASEPQFPLLGALGGSPDEGGVWTAPGGGASNGTFVPGTSPAGEYTYTIEVSGSSPCSNVSATVNVIVDPAPNAGLSDVATVCDDVTQVELFDVLGGNPDAGGTWTDDDDTGTLSGSLFSPFGLPPGDYNFTYTVPGIGLCDADSATVTVTVVDQLNAGSNATRPVCGNNTNYVLLSGLNGNPQPGGDWSDDNGTGAVNDGVFNAVQAGPGTYQFTYTLVGSAGCATASAVLTLNVVAAPNAGCSTTRTVCGNALPFNLFNELGCNPQPGGTWRDPNDLPVSSTFNPATSLPGTYTYRVNGPPPCGPAFATVTVSVVAPPNAGQLTPISVCNTDGAFNMTQALLGNPAPNGTWTGPDGLPHPDIFQPGSDEPGLYLYTVQGNINCANGIAAMPITVNIAPNAGDDAQETICSNTSNFLLFQLLNGTPQLGGQWFDPLGAPHGGVFEQGDPEGEYIHVVQGAGTCTADTASVFIFINQAVSAGTGTSIPWCSNSGSLNLFTLLGGAPSPTGVWTNPNNLPHSGIFNPGQSTPGTYKYKVQGVAPCPSDSATVTVTLNQAPNAGCNSAHLICSSQAPFPLFDRLGCTPQGGGTWTFQGAAFPSGIFTPGTSTPGIYTYTVPGLPGCQPASASVTISVSQSVNAGCGGTLVRCSTSGSVNLFQQLGCNAQPGGTWTGPGNITHSGTFQPGDPPGPYTYTINAQAPCSSSTATVEVVVNQAPNAGTSVVVDVCASDGPFVLIERLGGTPDLNGTWRDPLDVPFNGIFTPGTSLSGPYTYTVTGLAPCANVSSTVTVNTNQLPSAGTSAVITICSDQAQFQLVDSLGGSPDDDGVWTGPDNDPFSGLFQPLTSATGTYTYVVAGEAPCPDASATVQVFRNQAPDAGISAITTACSNEAPFSLFGRLNGNPMSGGTWTGPGGIPHTGTFIPGTSAPGTYVYRVEGFPPCTDATASVQVQVVQAPNPGSDGQTTVCVDDPSVPLFPLLGGTFNVGGTWVDLSGTGQLFGSNFNTVGLPADTYLFRYIVQGVAPCAADSATVSVTVAEGLFAGADSSAQVCSSEIVALFPLLGPGAQSGGTWTDLGGSGALSGSTFNATLVPANSTWMFRYVLSSSAECLSDTAFVTVAVQQGPNAGCGIPLNACSNSPAVQLTNYVGCGADGNGSWLDPLGEEHSGIFDPGNDPVGDYLYTVPAVGNCPEQTTVVPVTVVPAPNAGEDAELDICSNNAPVQLFTLLGPNAQPGGSWRRFPGNLAHPGTYDPIVDISGTYVYTITAQLPCANVSAQVVVTEFAAPNAGGDNSLALCSNQAEVNMITFLAGNPNQGGSWLDPSLNAHGAFFDPSSGTPGVYTYVVPGPGVCANDTAALSITVDAAPNPGIGGTVEACASQTMLDLFPSLGDAEDGGTWNDLDGTGALTGSVFDPSQVGEGIFSFSYTVPGSGACTSQSATLQVSVSDGANAGQDSTLTVCGADASFPLFSALAGTPDPGGTWIDPMGTGALNGDQLNATLLNEGDVVQYIHVVQDPGCGEVFATVTITVEAAPDAGTGGQFIYCTNDAPVVLSELLSGTPQNDGAWTGPSGQGFGLVFDPAIHPSGAYTYTVPGGDVCADATAEVTIQVDTPPDAGGNGELITCDTESALDLFTGLTGTPQQGGTWSDPDATGALSGRFFNATLVDAGIYDFIHTVSNAGCGSRSAVVKVTVVDGVEVNDLVTTCNERDRTYLVSFSIAGGDTESYVVDGWPGTISNTVPPVFTSEPLFLTQVFSVVVDDAFGCGPRTVEAVSPCDVESPVFVPESFSPNGDGINDVLVIPGIEAFPENSISIYNRWGAEVYRAVGYDNASKRWDGTSERAALGGDLPAGTYFFVLELGGQETAITGFIQLNR